MAHEILSIEFEPASRPGALGGYRYRCSCGESAKHAFLGGAEQNGRKHVVWANEEARLASARAQASALRARAQRRAVAR